MSRYRISLLATCLLALASAGCNTEIEKIFALEEGSQMQVSILVSENPFRTVPFDPFGLEGGTVMQLAVATTPLDYIDLTVDGDVNLSELLFAMDGVTIIAQLGTLCVGLQGPSGGTFDYALLEQMANFDITIDSFARAEDPFVRNFIGGDTPFPFEFQAEMPLAYTDALGLFLGTSDVSIEQEIYQLADFGGIPLVIEGALTLGTVDTFPVTPLLETCSAVLAE